MKCFVCNAAILKMKNSCETNPTNLAKINNYLKISKAQGKSHIECNDYFSIMLEIWGTVG